MCIIYTGWSRWPNSSPCSPCDSFQRWCITFSIPLGSASQDRLKLVGFFMVMDGISRIGIGLSGVCKARLVSWEKNHGETHEKPMISSKKNAFNPGISSNWWLVYLPPEEMMEFVRLDHPNWAANSSGLEPKHHDHGKISVPRWALVHTLALC